MSENPPSIHELHDLRDTPDGCGPWNPGIQSHLPRELLPLTTIRRPENVFTGIGTAAELRDLTGIDTSELVAIRPERLVLHEVLIRVTADLSVPSGSRVEDLGINFRQMVDGLLAGYIAPHMDGVVAAYGALKRRLCEIIEAEVAGRLFASASSPAATDRTRTTGLLGWLRRPTPAAAVATRGSESGRQENATAEVLRQWRANAQAGDDRLRQAAYRALARVVAALLGRHGRLWGTPELIASVATDMACNDFGSEEIGRLIEPHFHEAALREGYRLLPAQARPVIMNTKGASAAGKSTLRAQQQMLAEKVGVRWSEFALISPDIWRKQLLDYATLGPAYKYGAACTAEELSIIDDKLDRYMARKAGRLAMSHLLIDRFRFDSFAPDSDEAGSNLLTRFGHTVYLFFMITPPGDIVERAWQRGLDVGRYKAVDDLLAHNIEAYSGMPELFFTWALRADKRVHYEFLDNTVRLGETPRTVSFGWNGEMFVLDIKCMLDVQRYRKVNVDATNRESLFESGAALAPEQNAGFLADCMRRLPTLHFADQQSGRIYLTFVAGKPVWVDAEPLQRALADPETRAGILTLAPDLLRRPFAPPGKARYVSEVLGPERIHTLGRWGGAAGE